MLCIIYYILLALNNWTSDKQNYQGNEIPIMCFDSKIEKIAKSGVW